MARHRPNKGPQESYLAQTFERNFPRTFTKETRRVQSETQGDKTLGKADKTLGKAATPSNKGKQQRAQWKTRGGKTLAVQAIHPPDLSEPSISLSSWPIYVFDLSSYLSEPFLYASDLSICFFVHLSIRKSFYLPGPSSLLSDPSNYLLFCVCYLSIDLSIRSIHLFHLSISSV